MTPTLQSTALPNLRMLLDQYKQEVGYGLNCHEVGTIVSFDATKQTASVQIAVLRLLPGGETTPYPILTNCPVFVLSGGAAALTMPIAAGDTCLVLFNDRDLDIWATTGNTAVPNSGRFHDLSDGLVLVGFRHALNPVAGYLTTEAALVNAGSKVSVANDGTIALIGASGCAVQLYPSGVAEIYSNFGASITLDEDGKIRIANGTYNLKSLLDALCTALTSWTDTAGNHPNATTITAINLVKTHIDALLS